MPARLSPPKSPIAEIAASRSPREHPAVREPRLGAPAEVQHDFQQGAAARVRQQLVAHVLGEHLRVHRSTVRTTSRFIDRRE